MAFVAPHRTGRLGSPRSSQLAQTFVRLIATSIIYAWIYNSTNGSVLLVMLAHAGHNIAIDLMPPANDTVGLMVAFGYLTAAVVVVRCVGPELGGRGLGGIAAQFDSVAVGVADIHARRPSLRSVDTVRSVRARKRGDELI